VRAVVQIAADAVTGSELKLEIVFCPVKPAGLDVARDAAAVAKIALVDKAAVIDLEIAADQPEIDVPPGLRPVGCKGNAGRTIIRGVGPQPGSCRHRSKGTAHIGKGVGRRAGTAG